MSLSSSPACGKGVDSNAVDTYDSGDEWDIGVGNLIIDLDADLEKDKLEMSSCKEDGGMAAPSSAVAALPDNIKFVSPASSLQSKDGKPKSKRSKTFKESGKALVSDGTKKEVLVRSSVDPPSQNFSSTTTKGAEKSGKASRSSPVVKKDKDLVCGKSKKEKLEVAVSHVFTVEKDSGAACSSSLESQRNVDFNLSEQCGTLALDSVGIVPAVTFKTEDEVVDDADCQHQIKVVSCEKMESLFSTCAPPALGPHTNNNDISSPCEQIMVCTRSVAVSTAKAALATEPESLGPCEPGTSVNLEGIVWQETDDGMLIVNVTWRNKTYVGTLLDCTRHDWAPPRFCESPTSDVDVRNGRGRGKRTRPGSNALLNDNSNSSDSKSSSKTRGAVASSKGRRGSHTVSCSEDAKANPSSAKRKTKPVSDIEPTSSSEDLKASKRIRTNSTGIGTPLLGVKTDSLLLPHSERTCPSPTLIDCPHPKCNKKYKHINGLKYHQVHAHNDHGIRLDQDVDSEFGEEAVLHPDPTTSNGAVVSPKGRGPDAPSAGKHGLKVKKVVGEAEPEVTDGGEEGGCLTDETSSDELENRKDRKMSTNSKPDKPTHKGVKLVPPLPLPIPEAPSLYSCQDFSPATGSVVQPLPNSQPNPPPLTDPNSSPAAAKDMKKKDKKKRDGWKEGDSPKAQGRAVRSEEGKSPYSETLDTLHNGCVEAQQNRLASIKAEADKVYSFSDNAPSPSIGVASRIDVPPSHQNENGADILSKTSSPAYSDISDVGEDGEGKAEVVKVKTELDQGPCDGSKKALFFLQAKDSPYYPNYDYSCSPSYLNPSQGEAPAAPPHIEGDQVKVTKEEEQEVGANNKRKVEPQEERVAETGPQQASVIQQRSSMYSQSLYYNQYFAPPYSYPDPTHLLASNPAYRQQYEERQQQADRKAEGKDRQTSSKDEWKQKALVPPTLASAPADQGAKVNAAKPKDAIAAPEQVKCVSVVKGEDPKVPAGQADGVKIKPSEAGHHGIGDTKPGMELGRPVGVDPATWYRQETNSHLWPYVYPSKYSEPPRPQEDDRWKNERKRDRKEKEERPRPKEGLQKEEPKGQQPLEEHQDVGKETRIPHMQFTPALAQHQGYMPYMQGAYAYTQGFEPSHPGYRGMPSVMMQNYPASYLPVSYAFSSYGGKVAAGEDGEKPSRSSPTVKPPSEAKALELLQQRARNYQGKSPSIQDNISHERERERDWGRDRERDRECSRPRASPSQCILPSHHHLGYPLLSGQYDLSYASGKTFLSPHGDSNIYKHLNISRNDRT
uniref:C2H2-type domain-containing protein n=1 Tax=Nothobranchius pienaari TaxID=704102 RepID=A0A1A8L1K9_9TELE